MSFEQFSNKQQAYLAALLVGHDGVFAANVDGETLWETYLNAFPPGTNEIYRERRHHDCSCCRHFIKSVGSILILKDGLLRSIWDFETGDATYQPVVDALNALVTSAPINGVFAARQAAIGTAVSREMRESGVISWHHFHIKLPQSVVTNDLGEWHDRHNTNKAVFESSLQQITAEALDTALDLISQNSLYRGQESEGALRAFLKLKKAYDKLPAGEKNNFCWINSRGNSQGLSRIKNTAIGTFLLDLSQDVNLETALRKYEAVMAPTNYKRPQAVFTAKMVEEAKKTIEQLGLMESLPRRFARLDDITINDVLFADREALKTLDVFGKLEKNVPISPKSFEKVEEVSIDKFISDILPRARGLEILVENRFAGNFVSLIAPVNRDAPPLFKWDNGFSWAYEGNIADSMKQRVASLGGKIDGVLRFSIQWNDLDNNPNDYDAHCIEPGNNLIYYGSKRGHASGGMLDVDIIHPEPKIPAVENITWPSVGKMRSGLYEFKVHCFAHRGGTGGFAAEVEFGGEVFPFEYRKDIRHHEYVDVATVKFDKGQFELVKSLPGTFSSKEIWGVTTNSLVPVLGVMHSPNFWGDRQVGNRHTIFALKGCKNPTTPNGFFNEYLPEHLMPHKRVFEALGKEMKVQESAEQLSGLGFSSTQRTNFVVKVKGQVERIVRVTI